MTATAPASSAMLRLLGRDDVHDDAALEHLGQALLGGPGGGLDAHAGRDPSRSWASPRPTGLGVLARSGRAGALPVLRLSHLLWERPVRRAVRARQKPVDSAPRRAQDGPGSGSSRVRSMGARTVTGRHRGGRRSRRQRSRPPSAWQCAGVPRRTEPRSQTPILAPSARWSASRRRLGPPTARRSRSEPVAVGFGRLATGLADATALTLGGWTSCRTEAKRAGVGSDARRVLDVALGEPDRSRASRRHDTGSTLTRTGVTTTRARAPGRAPGRTGRGREWRSPRRLDRLDGASPSGARLRTRQLPGRRPFAVSRSTPRRLRSTPGAPRSAPPACDVPFGWQTRRELIASSSNAYEESGEDRWDLPGRADGMAQAVGRTTTATSSTRCSSSPRRRLQDPGRASRTLELVPAHERGARGWLRPNSHATPCTISVRSATARGSLIRDSCS